MVGEDDDVMLIENGGVIIRMAASDISIYSRATQGVRVMRLEEGNSVIGVERTEKEPEDEA